MHAAHIFAEHIQCIHRIALAVEHQVRGIQVDEQVAGIDRFKQSQQDNRCLLARFKEQVLSRTLEAHCQIFHGSHHARPCRICHVLRDKAHVGDNIRNSQTLCIRSAVQDILNAFCPECDRNEAQGLRTFGKIPAFRADPAAPESRDLDIKFLRQLADFPGIFLGPVPGIPAHQLRMMESLSRCIGKVCAELLPAAMWNNDAYVHG